MKVTREQAASHRLATNHVSRRLPPGAYVEAAYAGLQDTAPRDALLGLHARVERCEPSAWGAPGLVQTYGPRQAVYVLPEEGFGAFTVGRLPRDAAAREELERLAEDTCRRLGGEELRSPDLPGRQVCMTGRLVVRWTTSALYVREVPRPAVEVEEARADLCRRHVHAFGPTTPAAFAWWAGVSPRDAKTTWAALAGELVEVDVEGHRAWVLGADEPALAASEPLRGVRLLVVSDLRLLGQDRTGLFVGPGLRTHSPQQDRFHPNGLVVDGQVVGAWGRRRGAVTVRLAEPLPAATVEAVEAEALSLPIPDATTTVDVVVPR